MASKRDHAGKSKNTGKKKQLHGHIEARLNGELEQMDKITSLQKHLGNRTVNQLLHAFSPPITSFAAVQRQSRTNPDLPLEKGSQGDAVKRVQQALLDAGY